MLTVIIALHHLGLSGPIQVAELRKPKTQLHLGRMIKELLNYSHLYN